LLEENSVGAQGFKIDLGTIIFEVQSPLIEQSTFVLFLDRQKEISILLYSIWIYDD